MTGSGQFFFPKEIIHIKDSATDVVTWTTVPIHSDKITHMLRLFVE